MNFSHTPNKRLLELKEKTLLWNGEGTGFLIYGKKSMLLRVERKKYKSDVSLLNAFFKIILDAVLSYVITDVLFVTISLWTNFLLEFSKSKLHAQLYTVTFGNTEMNHQADQHIYIHGLVQIRSVVLKWISQLPSLMAFWIANWSRLWVCELFYL